jgi:glyoxylase-like metal-dependent hydrolase (beta-lactamase superfamily II)
MIDFNRRTVLAGAAAATAATALTPLAATGPALASAPQIGKQNAGWYRYKVGEIEITVVTDGVNRFKFPDGFVVDKSRAEVNAGLAAAFLQPGPDMAAVPYSPVVINTGKQLAVIDTGVGPGMFEKSKGNVGQFQTNLKASGIDPSQVDVVIISHFHGDHINGLLGGDGKPVYPKAEVMVPAPEWKYFMDDAEMGKQTTDRMKGVFAGARRVFDALGRKVTQYDAGKDVLPGVAAVATHGHTPGHMSFMVSSGKDRVFVQGDVTNIPLFVRNPDWAIMFDQDAKMAAATRRKVYDMVSTDRIPVQGFHYPFPALAYIEKAGNGYRENYVPWQSAL